MSAIILAIVGVLAPFAAGFVATELAKFNATINALSAPIPQLVGVAVAFGLAQLAQVVGFTLPTDLGGLNQDTIAAILTALAQMLFPAATSLKAARARLGLRK